MQLKNEILNDTSLLDEKLFVMSSKSEDTTTHIISFLPKEAIKEGELQKALSSFVFNRNCYYAMQPQRLEDAFVRHVAKGNQKIVDAMLSKHPEFKIHQLLGYIASGNQDEAEKMLEQNPELLLQSGSVIDPSGRLFEKIKPFELVLWTMDVRYMANMVLDCIHKAKEGDEIRIELLKQYKAVIEDFDAEKKTGGVRFTLNGKRHHEKHFDWQPLLNALNTYIENYDYWGVERDEHWCTVVGQEQQMLPMHVRHHYCNPEEPFNPPPTFNKKELKRTLKFYNYFSEVEEIWNAGLIGLGVHFGILRSAAHFTPATGMPRVAPVSCDLSALRNLCKVRTEDLGLLKIKLLEPIQKLEEAAEFAYGF